MVLSAMEKEYSKKRKQGDSEFHVGRRGFPGGSEVKNPPVMQETWVQSLGGEDPLEKCMATHSSILAWRFPWTKEPGGPQPVGSQSWTWSDWARTQEEDIWVKCKGDGRWEYMWLPAGKQPRGKQRQAHRAHISPGIEWHNMELRLAGGEWGRRDLPAATEEVPYCTELLRPLQRRCLVSG